MHLLYPCDPFDRKQPDEDYRDEFVAARAAGLSCVLFSFEDFQSGTFKALVPGALQGDVLYRGWMLAPEDYERLCGAVEAAGARMRVGPQHYKRCHYLPEWYDACREFTPRTLFCARDDDFAARLAGVGWTAFFVKDFVKSLTTSRGSVARNAAEVSEIVGLMERYRGRIEGGICIREFEHLVPDTEERYFVVDGRAHARDDNVPALVHDIARRIDSPFFSVDIVHDDRGRPRLIELGDGQVSDRKTWSASGFARMLRSVAGDRIDSHSSTSV